MRSQNSVQPLLIPLRDATGQLGFSDTRVTKRLVLEGKLDARTIGRRIMITADSLYKFAGITPNEAKK